MRRLYLRIYLAVLASLIVFALATGVLWNRFGEGGAWSRAQELTGTLAQNALPAAGAPAREQQAALERLAANLGVDVALFAADRTPVAAVGEPLPAPVPGERGGWTQRWGISPVWTVRLPDGRWLKTRAPHGHRRPVLGFLLTLALLALAVGIIAYPLTRRLTRRLERLQSGVESLGAGELSARVKVEGNDEIARLAVSFNRAATRIETLVGAHKVLLANASHELRTPLTRVRMAVELMKGDADPRRKAELEHDIAELDALIDEILLASRLESQHELEAMEEIDLLALAAEECARYECCALEGEPMVVRGEPRLLRRLIRNLLENAKRHGAPPIEVSVAHAGTGARIVVDDYGTGVPAAERERVFEPFHRNSNSSGTGLGLALVRTIAQRHGGQARCEPRDGEGSRFVVILPTFD